MEIIYSISGVNFKDFGVYVSNSDGILNRPQRKTTYSSSSNYEHGEMIDVQHNYVQPRNITLSCFMKANSKMEFIQRVNEFEQAFDVAGLKRFVIDVGINKPLIYEVYLEDSIEIKKTWSSSTMIGTFNLKLVEPEPVKRVLKYTRSSAATKTITLTMKSAKFLNVFWGDGSVSYDVAGSTSAVTITHDYNVDGDYFPVITGNIEEIETFTSNGTIVWNRL